MELFRHALPPGSVSSLLWSAFTSWTAALPYVLSHTWPKRDQALIYSWWLLGSSQSLCKHTSISCTLTLLLSTLILWQHLVVTLSRSSCEPEEPGLCFSARASLLHPLYYSFHPSSSVVSVSPRCFPETPSVPPPCCSFLLSWRSSGGMKHGAPRFRCETFLPLCLPVSQHALWEAAFLSSRSFIFIPSLSPFAFTCLHLPPSLRASRQPDQACV